MSVPCQLLTLLLPFAGESEPRDGETNRACKETDIKVSSSSSFSFSSSFSSSLPINDRAPKGLVSCLLFDFNNV